MEEELRSHLLATIPRVDWRTASGTLPAIRLIVVSAPRLQTYTSPVALVPYRIQADCFGRTYDEAKTLARAVIVTLETWPEKFDRPLLLNERDGGDTDKAGRPVSRTSLDYRIWYLPVS